MIIYEKPEFIQVSYRQDGNFILFDWTDFQVTLEEIQELHKKALAVALEKQCFYFIAETSKVRTVLRPIVVGWWTIVWVPKLLASGLKAIVTVVPDSALASLSTRQWQKDIQKWQEDSQKGIFMKNVQTLAEAQVLIEEFQRVS